MTTHDSSDHPGAPRTPAPAVDPALLRGLTQSRLGRRDVFRLGGLAGAAALLAACGVKGEKKDDSAAVAPADFWSGKTKAGTLDFSNWPLYMDVSDDEKSHPSLDKFTADTGIKVNYREDIQDNESYFGKVRPSLAAKKSIGADLIVITNGIFLDKFIQLGYLAPLDAAKLPTFAANADKSVKSPSYDPGNKYTVAWQSGLTGIAYDPAKTGREIKSYEDLFDPKFAGHVGMFGDNLDLPNLALVGLGINPEKSTPDDWKKAADKLNKQRTDGIVRKYYTQDYIDALASGDLWISMAWSGDVYQQIAGGKDLKFVVPDEGGILWTDNMCIPITAQHPVDAITYMDYVYKPEIAAMLAEYINYITPVPAAKSDVSAELADSPLIFPNEADLAKTHRFRVLTTDEETEWNRIFQPVYQS